MPLKDWDDPATYRALYYNSAEWNGHPGWRPYVAQHLHRGSGLFWHEQFVEWLTTVWGLVNDGSNGVADIGSGFAWTTERLYANMRWPVGSLATVDTSGWIQAAKGGTEEQDYRDSAGRVRDWLVANRPTLILRIPAATVDAEIVALDPVTGTRTQEIVDYWSAHPNGGGSGPRVSLQVNILDVNIASGGGRAAVRGQIQGARKLTDVLAMNVLEGLDDTEAVAFDAACRALPQQAGGVVMYGVVTEHRDTDFNLKTLAGWAALLGPGVVMLNTEPLPDGTFETLVT